MRLTLLLPALLAACAMPDLDMPEDAEARRAGWPDLVPFGTVTGRAAEMPEPEPGLAADLRERAAALRDRAARIGASPAAPGDGDRARRLRQRAEGLR